MIWLARIILVLLCIAVLGTPLCFGLERKPYGYAQFIEAIVELCLYLPILGRIFGWW